MKFVQLLDEETMKLYIDMDGVIVDFDKMFKEKFGMFFAEYEKKHGSEKTWTDVEKYGEKFWSEMKWLPDGKKLWNYVKKHNPTILSTPARFKESETGKIKWLKREIGKVPTILIKDKSKYADEKSVLVDDYDFKINAWKDKKGIGILHTSTNDTIKKLKKLGL